MIIWQINNLKYFVIYMKKSTFCKFYYQGAKSDHFDGKRFFNPWNPKLPSPVDILRWKLSSTPKPWPKPFVSGLSDIPPKKIEGSQLRISLVGHSTVLIQTEGLNILTDPIWSLRASPFKYFGPKRVHPPGIRFEDLPKIDLILISHNHYDHLDLHTIHQLWLRDQCQILAPLGNDNIIQSRYPSIPVVTLDWYDFFAWGPALTFHLEPAQHWSARGIRDKNKALWGAFVIKSKSGNIYFAGDTGYGDGSLFRQSKERFGSFRLAMLPIGAYQPKWFMNYAHMSPEDAVLAFQDLGSPFAIAIHHQTFHLADEGFHEPKNALEHRLKELNCNANRFRCLPTGAFWFIPEI